MLVDKSMRGELNVDHYITHRFDGVAAQQQAIDALHSGDCLRAVVRYHPYEKGLGGYGKK